MIPLAIAAIWAFAALLCLPVAPAAASPLAISGAAVCSLAAGFWPGNVLCVGFGSISSPVETLRPYSSFQSVAGGRGFLCGLRAGGGAFFCWDSAVQPRIPKRVYGGPQSLVGISVGAYHIAAETGDGVRFWRGGGAGRFPSFVSGTFLSLTSGDGFSCAIDPAGAVQCWGPRGGQFQSAFTNVTMRTLAAGDTGLCGLTATGDLACRSGEGNAPYSPTSSSLVSVAVGSKHVCAIHRPNNTAVCWSDIGNLAAGPYTAANGTQFEFLVADGNLTCGVTTANFSVVCWDTTRIVALSLPKTLPGDCITDTQICSCGIYPDSQALCSGNGAICERCDAVQAEKVPVPAPPERSKKSVGKGWIVFAAVGGAGGLAGVSALLFCLITCICRRKKVHNSVLPATSAAVNAIPGNGGTRSSSSPRISPSSSRSRFFGRQLSRPTTFQRQRSGPSSFKDRAEEFTLSELATATKGFSPETKIGAGSFGSVYRGKLPDGREVAIKRSEASSAAPRPRRIQEKESAFQSELAFLSRLHHKHLVGLVGYCVEGDERVLVYEYMKNGALFDHLHADGARDSPVRTSWKARIKVLLDAARGIEYLHNYAVPPIIHRDIKSSNILIDGNWTARVSDFGLSLMEEDGGGGHVSVRAAGTVGYMDPEYYGLRHLTAKSDVYGFGVVMLEALTGKKAIFRGEGDGGGGRGVPESVVDYAVPAIVAGEVGKVRDGRVAAPSEQEAEAVELVAYTAVHCVRLEGKDRPTMADVAANLETAAAICDGSKGSRGSRGSSSSGAVSVASVE